jgi:hypothetical protein
LSPEFLTDAAPRRILAAAEQDKRTDIEEGKGTDLQTGEYVVNDLLRGEGDGALGISQDGHPAAPAAAASPIR